MKKVVITGATSFLGRNMTEALLAQGYYVYALVRKDSPNLMLLPSDEKLRRIYGSLNNIQILEEIGNADIMIHFAWDGSGDAGRAAEDVQKKNVSYSMEALKVAHKLGCSQFFFSGSQAEYGICQEKIYEDMVCHPISPYGKAKIEFAKWAKEFCAEKSLHFIHLRIFSVYGYGDRSGTLVDACIRKFNRGESMELGPCSQLWNYLYIKDFVKLILGLIERSCESGIYNIAGTDTRVLRQFVQDIYECSNRSGRYQFGENAKKPEGIPVLNPDISKVVQASGYRPETSFMDGVHEIMEQIEKKERGLIV